MNESGERWILFATIAMLTAGVMRVFDAIWMFRYHGALSQHLQGALFGASHATYGWLYLSVGIILILAAVAVPTGSEFGRWIGMTAGGMPGSPARRAPAEVPVRRLRHYLPVKETR